MNDFTDMLSKAKAMQDKMKEAQEQIKKMIELCTQIVISFVLEGLNSSMNKFNGK